MLSNIFKSLVILLSFIFAFNLHADTVENDINNALSSYNTGDFKNASKELDFIFLNKSQIFEDNDTLRYTLAYYTGYSFDKVRDYRKALYYYLMALNSASNIDDSQISVLYSLIGQVYFNLGEYRSSILYYSGSIHKLRDHKYTDLDMAVLYYLMGESYLKSNQYDKAIEFCDKAIEVADKIKNSTIKLNCSNVIAGSYYATLDYPKAIKLLTSSLHLAQSLKMPMELADTYYYLGMVNEKLENYNLARQNFEEALKFYMLSESNKNIPTIVSKLKAFSLPNKAESIVFADNYAVYAETFLNEGNFQDSAILYGLAGFYYINADDKLAEDSLATSVHLGLQSYSCDTATDSAKDLIRYYIKNNEDEKLKLFFDTIDEYSNDSGKKDCLNIIKKINIIR